MDNMPNDERGTVAQVFPLVQDQLKLNSGTHEGFTILYCYEDGVVDLNWADSTSTELSFIAGAFFSIHTAASITITGGSFHLV